MRSEEASESQDLETGFQDLKAGFQDFKTGSQDKLKHKAKSKKQKLNRITGFKTGLQDNLK